MAAVPAKVSRGTKKREFVSVLKFCEFVRAERVWRCKKADKKCTHPRCLFLPPDGLSCVCAEST
eukprot:3316241-Ditylum_brightwellii.AAC.1